MVIDMAENIFPPKLSAEREQQLVAALLDCAGVYYDINFTKNMILGDPIQIIDGKKYHILEEIGKQKNCTYTEIVEYWAARMPEEEAEPYVIFSDTERIFSCYAKGERVLSHKFWTYDVLGNRMLAEQKIRLYKDPSNGDLLGLVYVSNGQDKYAIQQKEEELTRQYHSAESRASFLESLSASLPGGYHRVGVGDGFPLEFASDSFVEIVGWTREQLQDELDNKFINVVAPEDRETFMSYEPELASTGKINVAYRIARRDGERRWVQDYTQYVNADGREYYQCVLSDITDFVNRQNQLAMEKMELFKQKSLMETMEENMPSGYHRCAAEPGSPFTYIGKHFTEIVGFTEEEIRRDFGNLYRNLMWDEDLDSMNTYDGMLELVGHGNAYDTSVYRIKHKDGGYRWVTDSTMFVDLGEDSFFQGTISDVTDYIERLDEEKKRAEENSRAKSIFLFNASHDIRTPMNAIKGFAHIIKQNAENPEAVLDAVSKIEKAGDTLMTLLNDVLDLARIERGKDEINAESINLSEHGKNLYEMFASEMADAGLIFENEENIVHSSILADPLKLDRIGMNMLSNAKKFTPAGGSVTFGVRELYSDGASVTYRFFTRDTGIGMSKEFLAHAFEQFERERTSTESGVNGSGLGLAIIKRLVELMGGEVSIESELGVGTEISAVISFPLAKAAIQAPREPSDFKSVTAGKTVMLVEDNDFNREIARYILEDGGFEVVEAQNGSEAVGLMISSPAGRFDLILMDIQMPLMDGYTATMEIRSLDDREKSRVPIVAMTANAFDEDKERCLRAGMDGHIGKPIDTELLFEEIARVLREKKESEANV